MIETGTPSADVAVGTWGLTAIEAAERLARDGPNELPAASRRAWWKQLGSELIHFFALLLWGTSALAWVAGMPQLAVAIAVVVVINALFAFTLEVRASRAAERLKALLPRDVTVRRDGHRVVVDAREIVCDDLVLLAPGDRVPADGLVASSIGGIVDTSMLTGESVPTAVEAGAAVFAGTFLVEGEVEAHVRATGATTRLAQITRLTQGEKTDTPLTRELRSVVHRVAGVAVAVGIAFLAVMTMMGERASDGFLLAIGVTVALVPEALLPTVTLSLAWGAEQLAHRRVLVRNLEAVETLGSTTIVCTDKTGTLTRNEMTVVEAWWPSGVAYAPPGYEMAVVDAMPGSDIAALTEAASAAVLCSTGQLRHTDAGWLPQGDPMEVAIDVLARRLGVDTDQLRHSTVTRTRFPFDPRRRRMSVVTDEQVIVKGAPDAVLPLCDAPREAHAALSDMTRRGLRVLAVASRPLATPEAPATSLDAERDLHLQVLLGLEDPPRDDVDDAIQTCRGAGVSVVMVTGDHPTTALAIAEQVGLHLTGAPVVVGSDLPADDERLAELVEQDGSIVARVSPEEKLRIARVLRRRGHVVAMTGDGVNDGPALHEADIGIAMGRSGTDVAREAADLVLLDDHFGTIVAGIEQGRATYLNVRKFLTYHLTDNVAELTPFLVWALTGGRVPLALSVMQILALDIGTDTLSATALGAEPPREGTLGSGPVSGRLLNATVARRAFGLLGPTMALGAMVAFVATFVAEGWRPGDRFPAGDVAASASGAAFMTIVIAQTANAWACRSSTVSPWRLGWLGNRLLPIAASIELAFSFAVLLIAPFAKELGHRAPPAAGWIVALATAGLVLAVDGVDKRRRARGPRGTGPPPLSPPSASSLRSGVTAGRGHP